MAIVLVLGRDGMGDASESDFEQWVDYVVDQIDEQCGFTVGVDMRGSRDVQSDEIRGGTDAQRQDVLRVKEQLWESWCAEGAASGAIDDPKMG